MKRRSLWLAAVLGAAVLAFAWAGAPNAKGPAGDGADVQARSQTQVQTQTQERAMVQTRTETCEPAGDVKQDRIQLRLHDGSCLEEATVETSAADLVQDRIRDKLQDGSCLSDGSCVEHDYDYDHGFDYDFDYGYDHLHDGPPPDGGYGAGSS
jgi:hypothetical protein